MRTQQKVEADRQTVWVIDPTHTSVEFTIRNLFVFTVEGNLKTLEGTIVLDSADVRQSSVTVLLKSSSIKTGNNRRDAHLRTVDFFDAERYPEIRFESTQVAPGIDRDTLRVAGLLTVKDKSKEIVLDVSEMDRSRSPSGEYVAYYTARTGFDRLDFGIGSRRPLIGRKVQITMNVQAVGREEE